MPGFHLGVLNTKYWPFGLSNPFCNVNSRLMLVMSPTTSEPRLLILVCRLPGKVWNLMAVGPLDSISFGEALASKD